MGNVIPNWREGNLRSLAGKQDKQPSSRLQLQMPDISPERAVPLAQMVEQLNLYLLAYLSGKQYLIRLDLEEGVRVFFVFAR